MYLFARDTQPRDHRCGGLNNKNFLSHGSGSQKSKIRLSVRLVPLEVYEERSAPAPSPCHVQSQLLLVSSDLLPSVCLCVDISPSYKDTSHRLGLPNELSLA